MYTIYAEKQRGEAWQEKRRAALSSFTLFLSFLSFFLSFFLAASEKGFASKRAGEGALAKFCTVKSVEPAFCRLGLGLNLT